MVLSGESQWMAVRINVLTIGTVSSKDDEQSRTPHFHNADQRSPVSQFLSQ